MAFSRENNVTKFYQQASWERLFDHDKTHAHSLSVWVVVCKPRPKCAHIVLNAVLSRGLSASFPQEEKLHKPRGLQRPGDLQGSSSCGRPSLCMSELDKGKHLVSAAACSACSWFMARRGDVFILTSLSRSPSPLKVREATCWIPGPDRNPDRHCILVLIFSSLRSLVSLSLGA